MQRFALPPVITASTWSTLAQAVRGHVTDGTNREAVAVIAGLRDLGRGAQHGFALWYQFAAVAYGWSPDRPDVLDATDEQADRVYDEEAAAELWSELGRIAAELDAAQHPDPRIALDDVFDRDAFQRDVMTALAGDGARASFKIPLPVCRGTNRKPEWDPVTKKLKCPGGLVQVDDPITAALKATAKIVAVVALAAGLTAVFAKRRRRRRR